MRVDETDGYFYPDRIEHYRLTDGGWLLVDLGIGDTLELASIAAEVAVAEIYDKWDLLPDEPPHE